MSQAFPTAVQTASQSIRQAANLLTPLLSQRSLHRFSETLLSSSQFQSGSPSLYPSPLVAAWNILAMWLTGVVTNNLSVKVTLREAADWFLGNGDSDIFTDLLSARGIDEVEEALPSMLETELCRDFLPYILDPHGPGSRLSVMRDPTTRGARVQKRAEGVFYTPPDVATYMVRGCFDSLPADMVPTVYDPACGTGVFLRAALRELIQRHGEKSASSLAFACLFGTDLAPWPSDASAFVLLADLLVFEDEQNNSPAKLWLRLRHNLGRIDTLLLDPFHFREPPNPTTRRVSLAKLFSHMREDPTVIVGNPPYADLGHPSSADDTIGFFKTLQVKPLPTAEVYVAFLEQMVRLGNPKQCACSLVLPLSIASNIGPQFAAARRLVQETPGQWRFAFFDREPQGLFGEEVKTRNAILFWSRDASSRHSTIATGPLRKWRGDRRHELFNGIQFTRIHCDIQSGIPKVQGSCQASALESLGTRWHRLEQAVLAVKRLSLADTLATSSDTVFVGTTAYNFLNVFLRPPATVLEGKARLSENQLHAIHCATPEIASAVFAILTSHLAYWWWHTHGDGFHVLRRFIINFPFGNDVLDDPHIEFLSNTGFTLWSHMSRSPTISHNRGRLSLAYNPNYHTDIRRSVDKLLVALAGVSDGFLDELQGFAEHTVAATPFAAADHINKRSQV